MVSRPELPDLSTLKGILLEVAQARSVDDVLTRIVELVTEDRPLIKRTCIWLIEGIETSLERPGESNRSEDGWLFLATSARKDGSDAEEDWPHTEGNFTRVPFSEPIIGQIARHHEPRHAVSADEWPGGQPEWARGEGIVSYVGMPIIFRDELLGVLGVFGVDGPRALEEQSLQWGRIFADYAAAAIANARAFQQVADLHKQLQDENEYLREEVEETHGFGRIIGNSRALLDTFEQVTLVAPTDASVIVLGESGTGKELIARALHEKSNRSNRPFIKVNCASIPRELFESEFFGHVKGSFTGAIADRTGRFQLAHRGTLFLDEVGELPMEVQGKLLRVLQEGTYERVGEDVTRKVDVRLISATNHNLEEAIAERRMRQDLYFRLRVFPIELAPLRDRAEDVPLLAQHFLDQAVKSLGLADRKLTLTERHKTQLMQYSWPGNVRELQNVVQRAAIMARKGPLDFALPDDRNAEAVHETLAPADRVLTYKELKKLERSNVQRALQEAGGKVFGEGGAAELLDVSPTTLTSRIKAMKIKKPLK